MWFVDLAPLTEGIRVAETVAQLLGVREEEGGDLIDRLIRHVQNKRLLLVLDNCEHLLSASAMLADALLNASSEIRILATSQEGLGIDGERLLALRSLSVPSADAALNIKEVAAAEAVRLFLDRAQITQQSFVLTEGNAVAVAEICRHLDGIPLAIELAAARVRILSVEQIAAPSRNKTKYLPVVPGGITSPFVPATISEPPFPLSSLVFDFLLLFVGIIFLLILWLSQTA